MDIKFVALSILIGSALFFVGCSKEYNDDHQGIIPIEEVAAAFSQRYPYANDITFKIEGLYYVADFMNDSVSASAWFTDQGKWMMEKVDILYSQLPLPVIDALKNGVYGDRDIDKTELINRSGMTTVYKIEVGTGATDTDLYYSQYGNQIKVVGNASNNHDVPIVIPNAVTELLGLRFGGAALLDIQPNSEGYELNMLDDRTYKIIQLNKDYKWQNTMWQIVPSEVPSTITGAFGKSDYAGDKVEAIFTLINADGSLLLFKVIHEGQEVVVAFDASGKIVRCPTNL